MKGIKFSLALFLALLTACAALPSGVTDLRCEMLCDPQGIDCATPRLSWVLGDDAGEGVRQVNYRILVASSEGLLNSDKGDLWDSGVVESDRSILIPYGGAVLTSRQRCWWKVKITTTREEMAWSEPAFWSMGLLRCSDWKAEWIGLDRSFSWEAPQTSHTRLAARYFRTEFLSEQPVRQATIYVSGLGLYELYLNGARIGDQELAPAPTDYTKSILYNTFDVTEAILTGGNALGVVLGNGRFFTMRYNPASCASGEHWVNHNGHFGYPKLLLQLEIEYEDGTARIIRSDEYWKTTADGPIRSNNEFDGEVYDATKELTGWADASYDDSAWLKVDMTRAPGGRIKAQLMPPIRVMDTLRPVAMWQPRAGMYVLDMGQNMVGRLRMKVRGERGDTVTLRFAERLTADSCLYMDNIREAEVTDRYILKGGDAEWEPSFTYHGFRYVEVTGWPGECLPANFEGHVLHDDMEVTGEFECSDSTLNQIYRNACWGIRGNYRGMPTDCPQRDERMGWLGDRATGSQGESYIYGVRHLYAKWLDDIADTQRPDGSLCDIAPNYWYSYTSNVTWPAAYIFIAEMLYRQYGDLEPIARHYDSMKMWLDHMLEQHMEGYIVTHDQYGDWCMPPATPQSAEEPTPDRITDGLLLGTAYYCRLSQLMADFAVRLGREADAAAFAERASHVREAYNERFFNADGGFYGNNTVTANLLSLGCGLVPAEQEERVFAHATRKIEEEFNGHVSVGLIGVQWLMRVLSDHGRADLALRLAMQRDYPSWGYMIEQGATTIWELWNGDFGNPAMNSHNHVMLLGDLIPWFYQYLAGIRNDPQDCGFRRIVLKPDPVGPLTWVRASYRSSYGTITSHWTRSGRMLDWQVTVPPNTSAAVWVPAADAGRITVGGVSATTANGLKFQRTDGGYAVFTAESGDYLFHSEM